MMYIPVKYIHHALAFCGALPRNISPLGDPVYKYTHICIIKKESSKDKVVLTV